MSFWKKVGEVMEGGLLPPDQTKPIKKETTRKEVTSLVKTQQDSNKNESEHKHQWELFSTTHAPARKEIDRIETLDKDTLKEMLFGVTVFLWKCLLCHELQEKQVVGSDLNQLDDIMDKAENFGPQYVQRTDGQTFVVMKYQQPQGNLVPVR